MNFLHTIIFILTTAAYCLGAMVVDIEADVVNLTGNITAFTDSLSALDPNNFLITAVVSPVDALFCDIGSSIFSLKPLIFAAQGVLQALNESTMDALVK
jgi:hypothetical protein